jgi:hypothetical protein
MFKQEVEFAKYRFSLRQAEFKPYKRLDLLNFLYKVEYREDGFAAECSFTLLDWIIC